MRDFRQWAEEIASRHIHEAGMRIDYSGLRNSIEAALLEAGGLVERDGIVMPSDHEAAYLDAKCRELADENARLRGQLEALLQNVKNLRDISEATYLAMVAVSPGATNS